MLGLVFVGSIFGYQVIKKRRNLKKLLLNSTLFFSLTFLLIGSLFMNLYRSKIVWDVIPLMKFIQFPWRFMGVSIIFVSLVIGFGVTLLNKKNAWIFTILAFLFILINTIYFKPEKFITDNDQFYYTDKTLIQTQMSQILPDYIPNQIDVAEVRKIPFDSRLAVNSNWIHAIGENELKGHEKLIKTNFTQPTQLDFKVASYPGWKLEVDGQVVDWTTSQLGNITYQVPAGNYLLGLYFGSTSVRLLSDLISGLSLVVFLYIVIEPKTKLIQNTK